eukprot:12689164-Prorocentrum_lima.AAC.1
MRRRAVNGPDVGVVRCLVIAPMIRRPPSASSFLQRKSLPLGLGWPCPRGGGGAGGETLCTTR